MLNMDVKRLKQSCKKAFIIVTAVFSASVVLLAGIMAYFGWLMNPEIILRLFLVYSMLFVLTVVRTYLIGTKWAQNKPYVLVNIMFAPLYFGFAMLGVLVAVVASLPIGMTLLVCTGLGALGSIIRRMSLLGMNIVEAISSSWIELAIVIPVGIFAIVTAF